MPAAWWTDPCESNWKFTGPQSGNRGCQMNTYDLGWREVWKALLRGQGVLARLPVGQGVLLLGCCGQQVGEGFSEGCPVSQQVRHLDCLVTCAVRSI